MRNTTLKPVGVQFKRVADISLPLEWLHDAQGLAMADRRAALERGDAEAKAAADAVLKACGRLLMLAFGGRNRHYDPAPDRAVVKAYLHPAAARAKA